RFDQSPREQDTLGESTSAVAITGLLAFLRNFKSSASGRTRQQIDGFAGMGAVASDLSAASQGIEAAVHLREQVATFRQAHCRHAFWQCEPGDGKIGRGWVAV